MANKNSSKKAAAAQRAIQALIESSADSERAHAQLVVGCVSELLALSTTLLQAQIVRHRFTREEIAGFQAVLEAAANILAGSAAILGCKTPARSAFEVN